VNNKDVEPLKAEKYTFKCVSEWSRIWEGENWFS